MHAKALDAGADEVVFDLEDAVAAGGKDAAREEVARTLASPAWVGRRVAVRVNPLASAAQAEDLAMCATLGLEQLTIVVPKVNSAADVEAAAQVAPVQALIESPRGLAVASSIASHDAVHALILGYADLAAALGRRGAEHDLERWLVAQEALLAGARIGQAQAIDGPFFGLRDERGVASAARAARELGFDGKWAIHPAQVAAINAAFSPSPRERRWAAAVTTAVERASLEGGAAATVEGAMVDEAMLRQAEHVLSLPYEAEPETASPTHRVAAPYYEELARGSVFTAPGLTLTEGHAALHQSIVGDRLRLSLDTVLYEAVTGTPGLLAHPMLVCDVAIGQSTGPSARVLGNLLYRGLGARPVPVGTTLRTTTEVAARRDASRGRGIVALHVRTVDGSGEPVLDFWRAPLLPSRADGSGDADDLALVGEPVDAKALVPDGWRLEPLRAEPLGALFAELLAGDTYEVEAAETVTAAPELARLSLNVAHTHTDASAGALGERLVYGGHVIGVAAAHVTRTLPDMATILAWKFCDHLGPTFEGDLLRSRIEITDLQPLADGGLVHLRVLSTATEGGGPRRDVLDWRLVALMP